jgi:hypothetical protein
VPPGIRLAQAVALVDLGPERRQRLRGVPPRCLASPGERTWPGAPARGPAPGVLARLALGPRPSLPVRRPRWPPWLWCCRFLGTRERSAARPPSSTAVPRRGAPGGPGGASPGPGPGLPGPAHQVAVQARGLRPRQVRRPPGRSGGPAVACRVCGARRHPGGARVRGSLPGRPVPLSTLPALRDRRSRLTRGQRGGRDLHCRRRALLPIVPVCPGTPERPR